MTSLEELRNERLKKLESLKERGVMAYPISARRDVTVREAHEKFKKFSQRKKPLFLVGRVLRLRAQGGLLFFDFTDGTGTFQGLLKKDEIGSENFNSFSATVDIGDFIEVSGTFFVTKKGEETILVKEWKMLAKALHPLPEKWHGLKDVEEKFRKRYLDTLMSEEVKQRFTIRSRMISTLRSLLDTEDFLEVETPTLQPLYGGATAEPFTTHHNTLDTDLYLRISNELYLKRLLIGNFPKVYEIYKAFRNEGIDVTHYPEFTMIEFYESYSNASSQMEFVEHLLQNLVKKLFKKTSFLYNEATIELGKPFKRISYFSALSQYALFPKIHEAGREELFLKAQQLGVLVDKSDGREKILDGIFKKACRPKIIQPTFIIDYPIHALPLAKKKPSDAKAMEGEDGKQELADAFQLVIGGIELAKGFSELNDPIDQRKRFEEQEKNSANGDKEAQKIDEDFLEALEYGMPPAGGVGIGLDRLAMLLTNTHNIKDVILFPTMRHKT